MAQLTEFLSFYQKQNYVVRVAHFPCSKVMKNKRRVYTKLLYPVSTYNCLPASELRQAVVFNEKCPRTLSPQFLYGISSAAAAG